jgi:hypothetical protein
VSDRCPTHWDGDKKVRRSYLKGSSHELQGFVQGCKPEKNQFKLEGVERDDCNMLLEKSAILSPNSHGREIPLGLAYVVEVKV